MMKHRSGKPFDERPKMKTAHTIIKKFMSKHNVSCDEFNEWFAACGHSQDEANIHDGRLLHHLETFVEERTADGTPD